jgi:wyosine [tRNA(Phe)-imidazoG37] synthetase (radical SAM superfamily)
MGKYTFGPVSSRRFGVSLGIDLSPDQKSCNFDCLYCELPKATRTDTINHPPSVNAVIDEVHGALIKHPLTEVITITANGEPTLYPHLEKLIDILVTIKGERRLLILSNASTLHNSRIRRTLAKLDTVKLSLDCVTPRCFTRIDRPLNIGIETVIESLKEFRREFAGELVIEILLVAGINDTLEEFHAFAPVLKAIRPDRIDIGTIDRPPAYDVLPVPYEKIALLAEALEGLPVTIVTKKGNTDARSPYSEEEILSTFAKRPFTQEDVEHLLDEDSVTRLKALVASKKVETRMQNGILFYHTKR